jgi:mono/diheme cytochrome c family protein
MKRALLVVLVLIAAALSGAFVWANRHGEIAAIEPPTPDSFDAALVERGEVLAGIGNCKSCHTAPNGAEFAGGYSTATPFGIVYSTNITPDPATGIGTWSEAAFARAMREGIDREGRYLYPVFPYDHFHLVTDEDISALYAYVMTREPAESAAVENELGFPYRNRLLIAGWQALFLDEGQFVPDPAQSETWNRGAYLVEGLGHCGACHTPRNRLGGATRDAVFAGTELAGGWYGPAMDEGSPAVVPWTEDSLVNYLLDGWDRDHGTADGPMREVVANLNVALSEDDAYAMAEYLLGRLPRAEADRDAIRAGAEARSLASNLLTDADLARTEGDPQLRAGQELFARSCANCHRAGADTVPLALTTALNVPDPGNAIAVTRFGVAPPPGAPGKTMPAFAALTPEELAALARFMRWQFTDHPPWDGVDDAVAEILETAE